MASSPYEPQHEISNNVVCATSKASDQPAHSRSLSRARAIRYSMSFKLLAEIHSEFLRLKGDCTCSSESTVVKIPHCWKSHVTAHMTLAVSGMLNTNFCTFYFYSGATICG